MVCSSLVVIYVGHGLAWQWSRLTMGCLAIGWAVHWMVLIIDWAGRVLGYPWCGRGWPFSGLGSPFAELD
jgi:hypothetical protein